MRRVQKPILVLTHVLQISSNKVIKINLNKINPDNKRKEWVEVYLCQTNKKMKNQRRVNVADSDTPKYLSNEEIIMACIDLLFQKNNHTLVAYLLISNLLLSLRFQKFDTFIS